MKDTGVYLAVRILLRGYSAFRAPSSSRSSSGMGILKNIRRVACGLSGSAPSVVASSFPSPVLLPAEFRFSSAPETFRLWSRSTIETRFFSPLEFPKRLVAHRCRLVGLETSLFTGLRELSFPSPPSSNCIRDIRKVLKRRAQHVILEFLFKRGGE